MQLAIHPAHLSGQISAIPSKSVAHRALICAAFAQGTTTLECPSSSRDIDATVECLRALGCRITRTAHGFRVLGHPSHITQHATLACSESGSTLRFMLPVVAALGCGASFVGEGRLAERPLSPLYEELERSGIQLSAQGTFPLEVSGTLNSDEFFIAGNVSSQYITGLLLAAALIGHKTTIHVTHPLESEPYIQITCDVLSSFGIQVTERTTTGSAGPETTYEIAANQKLISPGTYTVEGDWSNSAFWLCAAALGNKGLLVEGLSPHSRQGDRQILAALAKFGAHVSSKGSTTTVVADELHGTSLNVESCPDLVPPLACVASLAQGTTTITGAARLRLKESDRLESVSAALNALGAKVEVFDDGLIIEGVDHLQGGTVDAANDHRIAMMAAIAATRIDQGTLTLAGAECVSKSYPAFFDDYRTLGGTFEIQEERLCPHRLAISYV